MLQVEFKFQTERKRLFTTITILSLLLESVLVVVNSEQKQAATTDVEQIQPKHPLVGASNEFNNEEFPHLLHRLTDSRRLHIISEHNRNGHRLQIEEYLDLKSWTQLIQFKWHEETPAKGDGESENLTTKKINLLIYNDKKGKFAYEYEPFKCTLEIFDDSSEKTANWRKLLANSLADKPDNFSILARQRHLHTIESLTSTLPDSPYLVRIPLVEKDQEAWVFGISGLWIKAQHRGYAKNLPPKLMFHYENNKIIKDSKAWRLDLEDSKLILNYYFEAGFSSSKMKSHFNETSNAEYDFLSLIELRESQNPRVVDSINVLDIDFNFSDRLSRDLFKLPIGFNCPTNPSLTQKDFYFENLKDGMSKLMEFELIATKYKGLFTEGLKLYSSTSVKTLTLAESKHPINSVLSLRLYELREDQHKTIRDFHTQLRYTIWYNHRCEINRLHMFDSERKQAIDSVDIYFDNGITLTLNEVIVDFLLGSNPNTQLLNRISSTPMKDEFVFESQVPEQFEHIVGITDASGKHIIHKISIVYVFQRPSSASKQRSKMLRLSRVILLVFDYNREQKLAEIRLNFIKKLEPLSFTRRAHLFDLSPCYNRNDDSMELSVHYPAEPNLIDYAQDKGYELIEQFYRSPLDWWSLRKEKGENEWNSTLSEKKRLALSLNFLRIPKAEFRYSIEGELELKLLILDKPSPLDTFFRLTETTFVKRLHDEILLLETTKECSSFCQQFKCNMFSFDTRTHECKLSPLSLEDSLGEDGDEESLDSLVSTVHKSFCTLHYNPAKDSQAPDEESSLIELYAYLEHSANDYTNFVQRSDEDEEDEEEDNGGGNDDNDDNLQTRQKRSTSISQWPLMSFRFTDNSNRESKFVAPIQRFLVPSEYKLNRLPLTLDVFGENEKVKVAESFSSWAIGRGYILNSLDNWNDIPNRLLAADERTFIQKNESVYYTMKRLHSIEMAECAEMCYNIEDWNQELTAKQICVSYSYCNLEKQCVLAIRSDFKFVNSLLDLVEEGDIVHEINTTDNLLRDITGCIVNKRNYLTDFEGPIKLETNFFGEKSTEKLKFHLEHEWETTFKLEAGKPLDDAHEECAQKCDRSNGIKQMCLAFDYCNIRVAPKFDKNGKRKQTPDALSKHGVSCNLLLIKSEETSNIGHEIVQMRSQLTKSSPPKQQQLAKIDKQIDDNNNNNNKTDNTSELNQVYTYNCDRYLVSHLKEFNSIKQNKLSDEFKRLLSVPKSSLNNLNLDTCALECSIRQIGCLAFEYCNKFDEDSGNTVRNCTLFGNRKAILAKEFENVLSNIPAVVKIRSEYCHIYLRKDIKSLEALLNFNPNIIRSVRDQHLGLIIFFVIAFVSLTVIALWYLNAQRINEVIINNRIAKYCIPNRLLSKRSQQQQQQQL